MKTSDLNILLIILLLIFTIGVTGIVFLFMLLERPVESERPIPIVINETIYSITSKRYIFIYYSSIEHSLLKKIIEKLAEQYNFELFEYDIENPWTKIEFLENTSLPLILPLPIPSVLCINNESIYMLSGEALSNKENILLLMESCK